VYYLCQSTDNGTQPITGQNPVPRADIERVALDKLFFLRMGSERGFFYEKT